MTNRFRDALFSQSACNPGALCRSLANIQTDLYNEGMDSAQVRADPACRLIAYQIAYLFGLDSGFDQAAYAALYDICENRANGRPT